MIEFKDDSTFQRAEETGHPGLLVIGVGSAGINVVDRIVLGGVHAGLVMAIDSDEQHIKGSVATEKLLLGEDMMHGFGAGGDMELAARAMKKEIGVFKSAAAGVRTAVVVAGLGGGTGTGAAPEIVRELKDMGARVIVFGILPFTFQGNRRMILAKAAVARMRSDADAVFVMATDRLVEGAHGDIRGVLHAINAFIGQACLDLGSQLLGGGLIPVQLGQIKELLAGADSNSTGGENAWIGCAAASGTERVEQVIEDVLQSPFLDDGTAWKHADAVVVCLTAGLDLPLVECQKLSEKLKEQMPVDIPVIMGARLDPAMGETLCLSLILTASEGVVDGVQPVPQEKIQPVPETLFEEAPPAEAEEKVVKQAAAPQMDAVSSQDDFLVPDSPRYTPQRYFSQQEEFRLDEKVNRGRFEKTAPTMYNGQDLDVPTFRRLNMSIRL